MTLQNKKSLGQHWLYDKQILGAIATLAATTKTAGVVPLEGDPQNVLRSKNFGGGSGDRTPAKHLRQAPLPTLCVEIGPGLGTLTSHLLKKFSKVLAIEYDPKLATNLPKSFPGKNLEVVHADILDFDFSQITEPYVVAGNIPYYITSPIIDKLLSAKPKPARIVLLIQKEVADRAVAEAGKHSILSLTVQNRAEASLGLFVAKEFFTPPPKVDSEVLVLVPRQKPLVSDDAISLAKLGFSAPRKKLASNLAAGLQIPKTTVIEAMTDCHLSPDLRPADLTLADWQNLVHSLK